MSLPDSNPYRAPHAEPVERLVASEEVISTMGRTTATLLGSCCLAAVVVFSWLAFTTLPVASRQRSAGEESSAAGPSRFYWAIGLTSVIGALVNACGVFLALRHRTIPVLWLFLVSISILIVHGIVLWNSWQ